MRHELNESRTFQLERWRSVAAGITETANSTFIGLIAIQYYHASQETKGVLLSNTSMGLLLSPLILWFCATRSWGAAKGITWFTIFAGLACILAGIPHLAFFVVGTILAYICAAGVAPLYLSIYEGNYRESNRGRLFARNYFLRIISNIVFAAAAGKLLEYNLNWFPAVLLFYAACFFFSSWCVRRMPEVALSPGAAKNPIRALRHVRDDIRFRWTLISWMLLGFANLAMFPLRTEYLASPEHLHLSPEKVALYTAIVPNLARLVFNPIWGPLFDRMDFFKLRIILNTGFMFGFLSFFVASGKDDHWGLVFGAILFGISNAGADVVWNLWVTKIAPPEKTSEYMSVHTFLTGVRGVIAPIAAFSLLRTVPIAHMAFACAGMVLVASALLWREKRIRA